MRIIFCANDAGAGNSISPLIRACKKEELLIIPTGPSKKILSSSISNYVDGDRLTTKQIRNLVAEFKPDVFVSGASLGNTLDKKILQILKSNSIPSIYVLDYWSNLWQRFSRENKDFFFLPDKICVMNVFTKKEMLAKGFPEKIIEVTGNPYFDKFKKKLSKKHTLNKIVFVSQPISKINNMKNTAHFKFDEFIVLDRILSILGDFNYAGSLTVRLHPSEKQHKFTTLISKFNIRIEFDNDALEECFLDANLVIGINSAALLVANIMGKPIISYFPKKGKDTNTIKKCLGVSAIAHNDLVLKKLLKEFFSGSLKKTTQNPLLIRSATRNVVKIINDYDKN